MVGFQAYTASSRLVATMNGAAISIDTPMNRLADGTIASGAARIRTWIFGHHISCRDYSIVFLNWPIIDLRHFGFRKNAETTGKSDRKE